MQLEVYTEMLALRTDAASMDSGKIGGNPTHSRKPEPMRAGDHTARLSACHESKPEVRRISTYQNQRPRRRPGSIAAQETSFLVQHIAAC